MLRPIRRSWLLGLAALWLTLGVLLWSRVYTLMAPLDPLGQPRRFRVVPGEGLAQIGVRLAEQGFVSSHAPLVLWGRMIGADRQVQSGTYLLAASQSPFSILRTLVSGKILRQRVTIPEGLTCRQTLALLSAGLAIPVDSLAAATRDSAWVRSLGLPVADLEGYLFPETYYFGVEADPRTILATMVRTGIDEVGPARRVRAAELKMTFHEILTLASIVENEAAVPEERPRISAVYHRRLRLGWRLQADPTVAYALGRPGQRLTRDDLSADSPYNTYVHDGLPPGPISSPGLASIDAALWPLEACEDLYFVSRGDGRHIFSRTLEEHERATEAVVRRSLQRTG